MKNVKYFYIWVRRQSLGGAFTGGVNFVGAL